MPSSYTVYPEYDFHALCLYIAKVSRSDIKTVSTKHQLHYLDAYLCDNGVHSVLCEHEYVEKFYLSDYAEYFVRCFADYGRKASRVHFFDCRVDEGSFEAFLNGELDDPDGAIETLQRHYLGFMVIRPIPETFIAITCLRPYKCLLQKGGDKAVIVRDNLVNLFGIPLSVQSLPFQEQDKVVAKCSTAAIWSFLNAPIFQIEKIPSPSQITKRASEGNEHPNRTFPSGGLSHRMLTSVLAEKGLDPISVNIHKTFRDARHHFDLDSSIARDASGSGDSEVRLSEGELHGKCLISAFNFLKEFVYAYVSCGFPSILSLGTYAQGGDEENITSPGEYACVGQHAVTVAGFNFEEVFAEEPSDELRECREAECAGKSETLKLRSHRICEIYVHDDQLGPYSAAKIVGKDFSISADDKPSPCEGGSQYQGAQTKYLDVSLWDDECAIRKPHLYLPTELLLGVSPKIRIGYDRIKNTCKLLNRFIVTGWGEALAVYKEEFSGDPESELALDYGGMLANIEWDIRLLTVNQFKREMLSQSVIGNRAAYLASSWPKHVWVARGRLVGDGGLLFDYVFDATDIDQGSVYLDTIHYSYEYQEFCEHYLSTVLDRFVNSRVRDNELYKLDTNIRAIAQDLTSDIRDLGDDLEEKFGIAHPPSYIKEWEVVHDGIRRQSGVRVFRFGLPSEGGAILNKGEKYIWAVCENGYLHVGQDVLAFPDDSAREETIGHPTLTSNMWARIAGELAFDDSGQYWVINNASGRYCKSYVGATKAHLRNVKRLFESYFRQEGTAFESVFLEEN